MILVGDCLEVMRTLDADSVDAIVTDPPYGLEFMGKAWDTFAPGAKQPGFGKADGSKFRQQRGTPNYTADGNPSCNNCGGDKYRNGPRKCSCAAPSFGNPAAKQARAFQEFCEQWAIEALRVAKPGAHLAAFGGTRMFHRLMCGIQDAGWEIRDTLMWVYGSGFPKSHNLTGEHEGWGTALKPAWEPIILARKPLTGTVAANVQAHGTGALNIAACRIGTDELLEGGATGKRMALLGMGGQNARPNHDRAGEASAERRYTDEGGTNFAATPGPRGGDPQGRWPANLIHDGSDEVVACFPTEAGAAAPVHRRNGDKFRNSYGAFAGDVDEAGSTFHGDAGSAARFFYCAKASREDRNDGCDAMPTVVTDVLAGHRSRRMEEVKRPDGAAPATGKNNHPTVKPTDLMRWLCRLVTPPGGLVLDPFAGSGSTGRGAVLEGFRFTGIELDPDYAAIAEARIAAAVEQRRIDTAQFDMFAEPLTA